MAAPLTRDDFSSIRHHALGYRWSVIFFRKPVSTFRDHACPDGGAQRDHPWFALSLLRCMGQLVAACSPSLGGSKCLQDARLFEVLLGGEAALNQSRPSVAAELIDKRGALARPIGFVRDVRRQRIGSRAKPFAGLVGSRLLARGRKRNVIEDEHDHSVAAWIDIEQAPENLAERAI